MATGRSPRKTILSTLPAERNWGNRMSSVKPGAPNIYPVLKYRSAPDTIAWLTRAFSFKEHLLVRDGEGDYRHVELSHGAGIVMLQSGGEGMSTRWGPYVVVEDVGRPLRPCQGRRGRDHARDRAPRARPRRRLHGARSRRLRVVVRNLPADRRRVTCRPVSGPRRAAYSGGSGGGSAWRKLSKTLSFASSSTSITAS